jgi:hypothetical protein
MQKGECIAKSQPMFNVYSMSLEDFYNFGNLHSTTSSPLTIKKKCENGDLFKLSEMVWIQIRKESPGKLFLNIRRKKKY